MSKSNKGANPSKSQAPEMGIIKAFTSGLEAGEALGTASGAMLDVAHRMRLTIGSAYDKAAGFPQWGGLDSVLTEAECKVSKAMLQQGLAKKFDSMYLAKVPTSPDRAKAAKTKALFDAVGYSAFDFRCLTPQAKAALGKDNPKKAETVQAASDMLNKFDSAAWQQMRLADNKYHGRVTRRGRDEVKSVLDIVKGCKVGDVPAKIASLVEDGIEVPQALREFAAWIVKANLANIKK